VAARQLAAGGALPAEHAGGLRPEGVRQQARWSCHPKVMRGHHRVVAGHWLEGGLQRCAAVWNSARPLGVCSRRWASSELVPEAQPISDADLFRLREFAERHPRLLVITGAGLSTESGIPDYRSPNGSYSKGHKPITWQEFSKSLYHRQRYWSRSMAGWDFMQRRKANAAHEAVAELQRMGRVTLLVTQNVDRLHSHAGSPLQDTCELHGTIHEVECAECGVISGREAMQRRLHALNPLWREANAAFSPPQREGSSSEQELRPDGDVELKGFAYEEMEVPACTSCGGLLKPGVPPPFYSTVYSLGFCTTKTETVLLKSPRCYVPYDLGQMRSRYICIERSRWCCSERMCPLLGWTV
jgi:NAD-dependent SIR2 family protein deacetylase